MRRLILLIAFGVGLAGAPAAAADDPVALDIHLAAVNRTARTPEGRQVVAQRLSQELGVPVKTLQAQREETRLGWGQILLANRLAQRTGMSFEQIVEEFRSGRGWGVIARRHNLSVGELVSEVKASHAALRNSIPGAGAGRGRGGDTGVTPETNSSEPGDHVGTGPTGHGGGRGQNPGITSGAGAAGHGWGGGGLRGGGKR